MIEVFADVTCPFAYVGLARVVARRDAVRSDQLLHVRSWPLELVNGEALTGPGIVGKVAELRREVAPDLFRGFDPDHFPSSSLPALALAIAGYRTSASTGELVSMTLRRAVFEDGCDVANADVLDAIGRACGVTAPADRDAVLDDWAEGRRRGVEGSPHFFVGGRGFFCPALRITHPGGGVHVTENPALLAEFARLAFGAEVPPDGTRSPEPSPA